jgi:hypothetical protein
MEPVVIDNFLSPKYFLTIKQFIEDSNFSWFFKKDITHPNDPNINLNSFGFDNWVVQNFESTGSQISQILTGFFGQLLDTTECSRLSKSRIDMTMFSSTKHRHTTHVDLFEPHIASVFYITDSDAETIIYDKQCFSCEQYQNNINFDELKITNTIIPKENRLLFFDGSYLHTGCSPSEYKNRIIINSDLIK